LAYHIHQGLRHGGSQLAFLNVPPVQRAHLTSVDPASVQAVERTAIQEWNGLLMKFGRQFREMHADVAIFVFDTYTLFNTVLNNPKVFPQTAGYKNTTNFCEAYANGTPSMTSFNASCGLPVNEYFWFNALHPTYPMHNATAEQIWSLFEKVPPGGNQISQEFGQFISKIVKWKC
jgi:phospholipase/lecithinase/hemolysin